MTDTIIEQFVSIVVEEVFKKINLKPEYSEGDESSRICWDFPEDTPEYISPNDIEVRYTTPWVKLNSTEKTPDEQLMDFGLWLSEELQGKPLSRADLESCLQDWRESFHGQK